MARKRTPKVSDLKSGVIDAVEASFALHNAITENDLSFQDLMDGFTLAIDSGHGSLTLSLAMATSSLEAVWHEQKKG